MATKQLPAVPVKSLPGPESILRRELANGLVVLVRENFASPSVVLSGFLVVGSLDEPSDRAGTAALTASCLMRGTQARSFSEIYEAIESIGASLHVSAGKHHSSFAGKSLAEDLEVLLDLLAEVLQRPIFPKPQVERLRAEKLTALAIRDEETSSRAIMAFNQQAYPKHPYSISTDGYKETVAALTAADLRAFHRANYAPQGMVLVIVGAVHAPAAVEAVARRFESWGPGRKSPQPQLPPLSAPRRFRRVHVRLQGKFQCDLVMGVPGPARAAPDYLAALLGNNILGRFGMYGRIGDAVREKAGLAYYSYSTVSGGLGPGPWQVIAGVNPANLELAVELIQREVGRFVKRPPTAEELWENQAYFIGSLPLQLESNEGVAAALVNIERYQLGLDYYQRYPGLVAGVRRAEILDTAQRYLHPDRLHIASAGPDQRGGQA